MASDLRNLVSNLIGTCTAATSSPPHQTNDAASPRTDFPPRSPIESRSYTVAIDLTLPSPPPPAKQRTPPTNAGRERPWKLPREGYERRKLVREIKNCNGQIDLDLNQAGPFTDRIITSILMKQPKKPGYHAAHKVYNTIDDVVRPLDRVENRGYNNGLGAFVRRNNTGTNRTYNSGSSKTYVPSTSQDSYPSKRRKTEHNSPLPSSPFGHEMPPHTDDDVVEVRTPLLGQRRSTPPRQSAPSSSQRSIGSGQTATAGSTGGARSEFESTAILTNPHRKKARVSAAQKTPSRAAPRAFENGAAQSSPIVLDDDSPVSSCKTSRLPQFQQFQQGIVATPDGQPDAQRPEIVSKHFRKESAKINHSTLPPRGEPNDGRRATSSNLGTLRDRFRRSQPESVSVDEPEVISGDELAIATPETVIKKRSHSPSKRAPPAKAPKRTQHNPHEQGSLLKFARTKDFEASGPFLSLKTGLERNKFQIVGADEHGNEIKHDLFLSKINQAQSDGTSRIRLLGSRGADGLQYYFDLKFEDAADFKLFEDLHVAPATIRGKVNHQSRDHMRNIFSKPFAASHKIVAPAGLAQVTAHTEKAMKGEERPDRGSKLVDQLTLYASKADLDTKPEDSNSAGTRSRRSSSRPTRTTRATETICLEEDAPKEVYKFSQVEGLGAAWERQLNYGSGRRRAVVDFTDLVRLDEDEMLNDQLIDFYLSFLFNEMKVPVDKVYIFNTHFFATLTRKVPRQKTSINYNAVARWTSKEDLFSYDYIVVPINQDLHWYLAVICNVSNISRKLTIENKLDLTSEPQEQPDKSIKDSLEPDEDHAEKIPKSISPALLNSATQEHPISKGDDDMMLFDEESNLTLVDPNAALSNGNHGATTDETPVRESLRAETALMTIEDSTPKGILPSTSASPASSKKTRRKSGIPAKKWDPDEPVIVILDSLGGGAKSGAVRALKDYIRQEGQEKRGMEASITQKAYYAKLDQIPMQDNFSDCGVYLLGYAQKFFEEPDGFKNRLLKGEMSTEMDWPDMAVPKMRQTMRETLFKLHKEQEEERSRVKAERRKKERKSPQVVIPPRVEVPPKIEFPTNVDDDDGNRDMVVPESPIEKRVSPAPQL